MIALQTQARADRRSTRRWAAAALLVLSGCATVAPSAGPPPADVPAAWSAADAGQGDRALARWWLRFGDPLLADLVDQALQANTSIVGAQAALRQARALRDGSAAALQPALDSSASARRGWTGGSSTGNSFNVGLDASWELDLFGANRSALDASEAGVRASVASLGDVQVSIAAEVALSYLALRDAQARLAIGEDNLASQQETLQITRWREQAGLVTALDVEQARTAAEQTAAALPILQTTIDQSRHALAVLTGRPPAALAVVLAAPRALPQAGDDLALSLPAEALRQRPDVRAAEHQVTAALARVAQADAARAPDFRLGGTLGLTALTLSALGSGSALIGTLLAGVTWPMFDGGAAQAQVRAQQAALDQAQSSYRAAVLTALKDVEDALVALRGDRERMAHLQRAADAAANAAQLANYRYNSGLVDFQTVLDTQRNRLTTQVSLAGTAADVSADHVRLYKALGGGWQPDDGASPDPYSVSSEPVSRTPRP
jgi:multidrug efflux system outer membrane protein